MPFLLKVSWFDGRAEQAALWCSEARPPVPGRIGPVDDFLRADAALRRIRAGEVLVYLGDFQNARQLLAALGRRLARKGPTRASTLSETFAAERRQSRAEHELLTRLVVPLDRDYRVPLRRAPDVAGACREAWGDLTGPCLVPLRDLLGIIGAREWRKKGVEVPALGGRVHPHYAVFAPIRGEYVELVAQAAREHSERVQGRRAFDVGTGTGVLALVLARAGAEVVATDIDPRAVACARENAAQLGLADRVQVVEADLFPEGEADLIVCNPPWIPEAPVTALDRAVYDPGSSVLTRFLAGARPRLTQGGQAWLVLSDLAERLGLRAASFLPEAIASAGLEVAWSLCTRPNHARAKDAEDPLHRARSEERTTLYGLVARG
jgi:methylase of polypeptide subunit release factors